MSSNPSPIQAVEQELLADTVTIVEEINREDPPAGVEVSEGQKQITAYLLWEAAGAVEDSPLTLNFWLQAESILEADTPPVAPPQE